MIESNMCEANGRVGNMFLKKENKSLAARVSQNKRSDRLASTREY